MDTKNLTKNILAMFMVFLFAVMIGKVYHADFADRGEYFEVFSTYYNSGDQKVDDLKLTLYIPDLNVYYRTGGFDLTSHNSGGRYLTPFIPEDAPTGWHRMWFMITGEDNTRDYDFAWFYVR